MDVVTKIEDLEVQGSTPTLEVVIADCGELAGETPKEATENSSE